MTPEEIRAEAIERITNAIRAEHEVTGLTDGMGGDECRCGGSWASSTMWGCLMWRRAPDTAARYVDALGDLLSAAGPRETYEIHTFGAASPIVRHRPPRPVDESAFEVVRTCRCGAEWGEA